MHKDQRRVAEIVIPYIADRVYGNSPEDVRDCIVLNRLLSQGPDPLFMMEAAPESFEKLCGLLHLTVEEGRDAVESAHWKGPAVLFEEGTTGMPLEINGVQEFMAMPDTMGGLPLAWRREFLWLLLAGFSSGSEAGYRDDVSILTRVQRAVTACAELEALANPHSDVVDLGEYDTELIRMAYSKFEEFVRDTPVTFDERGFPHSEGDQAFYVLYKKGHKVVAAHSPDETLFWGTVPGTSLKEQGVTVDKYVSPSFGIVFPPRTEE